MLGFVDIGRVSIILPAPTPKRGVGGSNPLVDAETQKREVR